MYFLDAIQYPFKSDNWVRNIAIGFLLTLIPIVNWIGSIILMGYGLRIIRNYADRIERMPDFDDFTGDLVRGLWVFLALMMHALPAAFIIVGVSGFMYRGGDFSMMGILFLVVAFVLAIVLTIMAWVGVVRYAVTDEAATMYRVQENFNIAITNFSATMRLVINMLIFSFVAGAIIMLGFVFLFIPGLIAAIAFQYSQFYMIALWGEDMKLIGRRKRKPHYHDDDLYMVSE